MANDFSANTLLTKYPQDFTISREAAVALRTWQIGDCLREGNYDAAQSHYRWLIHDIVTSPGAPGAAEIK